MPRIYNVNTDVPAQPYNITQPFRPDRPAMTLTRWSGKWKHVKYAGNCQPAAYYTAPFDQDGIVGIYSTGFADCQCLCLLAGRVNRHHGDYYSAALAHLDAGDINGLDMTAFIAGTQYTAGDIAQGSAVNDWFFHVILAGNTYSMTEYMQERTVGVLQETLRIADRCITIYRGSISNGFGITRKGWTGVPTFGRAASPPALSQDTW